MLGSQSFAALVMYAAEHILHFDKGLNVTRCRPVARKLMVCSLTIILGSHEWYLCAVKDKGRPSKVVVCALVPLLSGCMS